MPGPYVRRDVWSLAPDDPIITSYADAVGVMQRRDASDPTSWAYQAAMHGSYSGPPLNLWNTCEHGGWFFVAWHRMYLYYFESIVRSVVVVNGGPDDWALPYWNYSPPTGNPALPRAFRQQGSPLYVRQRRVTPIDVNAGEQLPPPVVDVTAAMQTIPFEPTSLPITGLAGEVIGPIHFNRGFGALEQQPHNAVHDALGGRDGWMGDVNMAAQDPIFWLHHANIDRLWAVWLALGGRRENTRDSAWTGQKFTFYDEGGETVQLTPGEVAADTSLLGYTYDPGPEERVDEEAVVSAEGEPAGPAEIVGASDEGVRLTGRRTSGTVRVDPRARESVVGPTDTGEPQQVLLSLDDIRGDKNPGTIYGVYVNLPDDATDEQADTHRAGVLSFFGIEGAASRADGDEHVHSYQAGYDITALVRELSSRGLWDGENVHVTFHPVGVPLGAAEAEVEAEAPAGLPPVTVGRISVHYA